MARHRHDIVDRIRAVIWRLVVHRCELVMEGRESSDGELDDKFLGVTTGQKATRKQKTKQKKRPGAFAAIARFGADPRRSHRAGKAKPLTTLVAAREGFEAAVELDQSELWIVLGPGWLPLDTLDQIVQRLLRRLGYFRASLADLALGRAFCADQTAFTLGRTDDYQASLRRVARGRTIHHLALLCALRRLAAFRLSVDEARVLDVEIRVWMDQPAFGVDIGEDVREALLNLIELRIVRGYADLLPRKSDLDIARQTRVYDKAEAAHAAAADKAAGRKPRSRPQRPPERDDMTTIFIALQAAHDPLAYPHPIVPLTPELEALVERRQELVEEFDAAMREGRRVKDLLGVRRRRRS